MSGNFTRRFEVGIRIGADSVEDVVASLNHLAFLYSSEGAGHKLTSGGYGSSIIAVDSEAPHVTHDSYFEQVEKWIEDKRKEAKAGVIALSGEGLEADSPGRLAENGEGDV